MYSDKQIHVDLNTIVSFVIQSGQVSVGGVISVSCHVHSVQTAIVELWKGFVFLVFMKSRNNMICTAALLVTLVVSLFNVQHHPLDLDCYIYVFQFDF